MIRLHATNSGPVLERDGRFVRPATGFSLDSLFTASDPVAFAAAAFESGAPATAPDSPSAPIASQEIWAAGVTYLRSKSARMAESKDAGGGTFYDRVYEAERPELFFKGNAHRTAAPGGAVRIRADSKWNVPEPELTLAINSAGKIFGHTIGNDMSSRDIEGENPLYLPQAKVYAGSCAIGPCLVITETLPAVETEISIEIRRGGAAVFGGATTVGRIKRPLPSLAAWLFREDTFPFGAYLMTGTGVVPDDTFTLLSGDEIRITIATVGTLVNTVE
ncbi:MAG TPA: fumarylacetoacetate hydrolase family protein [Opitutaceae bacterium]